jgi:hypothetical protein
MFTMAVFVPLSTPAGFIVLARVTQPWSFGAIG